MSRLAAVVLLLTAAVGAARAQAVIDPGMTRAQVVAKLGKPAVEKSTGTSTYLFYRNGMEKAVGMSDIVVIEADKVVDAVFRSSARRYSGTSSSPSAVPAEVARKRPYPPANSAVRDEDKLAPPVPVAPPTKKP